MRILFALKGENEEPESPGSRVESIGNCRRRRRWIHAACSGGPVTNRFTRCDERAKRIYDGIVFEIKKEIPIDEAKQDPPQTIAA